ELYAVADGDRAGVGLLMAGDHAEERRLAGAVRSDDADNAARRQLEGKAVDQKLVAIALFQVLERYDVLAKARARRDLDGGEGLLFALGLRGHFLVALQARLRLGLPRLRRLPHPFEFAAHHFLAAFGLALF